MAIKDCLKKMPCAASLNLKGAVQGSRVFLSIYYYCYSFINASCTREAILERYSAPVWRSH